MKIQNSSFFQSDRWLLKEHKNTLNLFQFLRIRQKPYNYHLFFVNVIQMYCSKTSQKTIFNKRKSYIVSTTWWTRCVLWYSHRIVTTIATFRLGVPKPKRLLMTVVVPYHHHTGWWRWLFDTENRNSKQGKENREPNCSLHTSLRTEHSECGRSRGKD